MTKHLRGYHRKRNGKPYIPTPWELTERAKYFSIILFKQGKEFAKQWYFYGENDKKANTIIRDYEEEWKTNYVLG